MSPSLHWLYVSFSTCLLFLKTNKETKNFEISFPSLWSPQESFFLSLLNHLPTQYRAISQPFCHHYPKDQQHSQHKVSPKALHLMLELYPLYQKMEMTEISVSSLSQFGLQSCWICISAICPLSTHTLLLQTLKELSLLFQRCQKWVNKADLLTFQMFNTNMLQVSSEAFCLPSSVKETRQDMEQHPTLYRLKEITARRKGQCHLLQTGHSWPKRYHFSNLFCNIRRHFV